MRTNNRIIFVVLAALSLAALPTLAPALVHYDFEQSIFTEPPQPVLDHCVVEQNGVYHLFYLRGNPAVNIGHATTTDFTHWTLQTPVLSSGTWDAKLWAPYLLPYPDGSWLMYYTGANNVSAQQSGVAFSTDLFGWSKYPDPLYHPDTTWALWNINEFSHGRDPHVMEYRGRYYMFVTAKTLAGLGAVAGAVSDDLIHWQDIGPIYVHNTWHVLESVFILQHNAKFHMFFTEEAVGGTSDMTSDSLLSGWDISTRHIIDQGHAPQITDTQFGQMFSRHAVYNDGQGSQIYTLRFTPMTWVGDLPVVPNPLPLTSQWTMVSGDAFYYQPTWRNNAAARGQGYPSSFVGDGWINTYEYYTGPMGYGAPGYYLGDAKTGLMRSPVFTIQGNSMNLLVGGGEYPAACYVALVDANTGEVLFRETGRNSDVMDRRYWDLHSYIGRSVYIEIADLSVDPFGHIDVDDINESYDMVIEGTGGSGHSRHAPSGQDSNQRDRMGTAAASNGPARLLPNVPNPFNPRTVISYQLPGAGHVRLEVFDASGARVRTLVDAEQAGGPHDVSWDGTDARGHTLASGTYFYRLRVDGRDIATRKMTLLK